VSGPEDEQVSGEQNRVRKRDLVHRNGLPPRSGLYDPAYEHDACGMGFVANIRGEVSHDVIRKGIEVLENLNHRGAAGCDPCTGDGAGLLMQVPDGFFRKHAAELGFELPAAGAYAVGMTFLDPDADLGGWQQEVVDQVVAQEGQQLLGWRDVPVDPEAIGEIARQSLPTIRQFFVGAAHGLAGDAFERKLYVIRRVIEKRVVERAGCFHITSLSARTLVYKGLLLAQQMDHFYHDLDDEDMESALALVHSRYSTNTFPSWDLAHPFRYLSHNGEINTLRGNVNWMHAREGTMVSQLFGDDLEKIFPIIQEGVSDSASFDNMLEFLILSGRSLPHAISMMIPEAWEHHESMDEDRRAYYEYNNSVLEPWDGPASIAFTDGTRVGAVLDRNGLRPSRYVVTKDGFLVTASECGVLEIDPANVERKGRLQPGRIFFVDLEQGRIIEDEEIKRDLVALKPYREWVASQRITLDDLPAAALDHEPNPATRFQRQQAFGYTTEELKLLIPPMIRDGKEATGSMGEDAALACLSDRPRLLFHYFKQLFAQVTNPAIDSILERPVLSVFSTLGAEGNLLDETPEHARLLRVDRPILTDEQLARIRHIDRPGFKSATLPTVFKAADGAAGLEVALNELCRAADRAIEDGANLLILSDREVDADHAPIPSLLATGAVHHHLIRAATRTRCGLIVETGEAREIGHFALLIGYGAGAINPYLAFETISELLENDSRIPEDLDPETAVQNYLKATDKGLLKIFAKMGISTLRSYRGAQIFEAIGLDRGLVDCYFTRTASRVSGVGLDVIARESTLRHQRAFPGDAYTYPELDPGGLYQWRRRGERHTFNPATVAKLQRAVRQQSYRDFKEYSSAADGDARSLCTLRGLFAFKRDREPVSIDEVESAEEIMKRFCTGAMSYGSISLEAHQTLAIAMNRIGGKSNTGEGGEDYRRFTPDPNGDSRRSAIKQVASGRFGVTSWYLVNSDEMQIKIAQGAKPGEGGQLPGHKVDETIGKTRHSTPGVGLISPPPHHDIYSIEDLAQLIYDLKNANRFADVSVKLVAETGVGTVAAGVSKGKADGVLISGHDGGTGASPQTSIKYAGSPWEIGLAETQQTLVANDLRGRIRVQTDGGLKTGRDVVIGGLLGADEFGFSTAPLAAMGCILMRVCHLNTCPVGIATQDERLRKRFAGTPAHVVTFFRFVAQEVRELLAELGYRKFDELIGRVDRLEVKDALDHWKARGLDYSDLLYKPDVPFAVRHCEDQDHGLGDVLDQKLLELAEPALERGEAVEIRLPIRNVNRTVGTILGSDVSRKYGEHGLPEDTIQIHFAGSAGQSFGAWAPQGLTLTVEGDANDYCGKGLSGGKIIVKVPPQSTFAPRENIVVGNVVLYGATAGEAYFNGVAGERFCVRNSGANTVVEGVGDHGCEYMTGGRVVILGRTGRNFAAGMSGGYAYVLDEDGDFSEHCNFGIVRLKDIDSEDEETILRLVRRHFQYTRSKRADEVLRKWESFAPKFVKVSPIDYERALADRLRAGSGDG
jgi:glutamate synthase domain-containing protein 2/glutamate synthase domain-containing protein 1/glutamate synthase domain-containing protein 3